VLHIVLKQMAVIEFVRDLRGTFASVGWVHKFQSFVLDRDMSIAVRVLNITNAHQWFPVACHKAMDARMLAPI